MPEYSDISEIVFGGGARGGKSFLGSFWIISRALELPGSAWLIAREELKALKRTTLRTFFKVLGSLGLRQGLHYTYNAQDMVLTFLNGSVVFFSELKRIPSDPEFDRIGSYDLTGAWVDEAQEVCKDAKDALQFRFTVMSGNGWVTTPKTLYTCNPGKTWIYSDFWKPIIKEGKTIEGRQFITSLYSDNPYIDHEKYRKNVLRTNNKIKIERLLFGNFEYDDDPFKIFDYEKILDIFTRVLKKQKGKYISCDVARKGRDNTVIGLWHGLQLKKVFVYHSKLTPQVVSILDELSKKEDVPRSQIVVDEDGVGGGVVDHLPGCKGFVNNSSCIQPKDPANVLNYFNLKSQCYFKLAELVNKGLIGVEEIGEKEKEMLIEELDIVKQKDADKDGKVKVQGKDEVKMVLGRSPDISDMMMMRMFFEVQPQSNFFMGTF